MLEQRRKTAPLGWVACALTLPLLLAHCGSIGDGDAPATAGASGAAAQSGAAGALGGGMAAGGAPTSNSGAAGASESGGLGGEAAAGSPATDAGAGGALIGAGGSGDCGETLASYENPTADHVTVCSVIDYPMNPPVQGNHYPVWSAYKSYDYPVPLGFLVHNLEHGAVVILYNCPEGCAGEVASAQAFIDALPADPRCAVDVKHQVVMAPDPALPRRWAAVAWGHSLAADCFNTERFRTFYDANLAHGFEDTCSNGADFAADVCQ